MKIHALPSYGGINPFGLMLHTTGDGLAQKALASGDPIQAAIDVYGNMKEGPHYCIAPDGSVVRFRQPTELCYHAGVSTVDRADYLSGSWETNGRTPSGVVSWWKLNWEPRGFKSPQHLYPTRSPNESYIGIELIPCGVRQRGNWTPIMGTPATPKSRFTAEQYITAVQIGRWNADHFAWGDNWFESNRFLGHEDVDPKDRPGWDPGGYQGWFSWSLARGLAAGLEGWKP